MLVTQVAEGSGSRIGELVRNRIALDGLVLLAAVIGWLVLTRQAEARFLILVVIALLAFSGTVGPWRILAPGLFAMVTVVGLLLGRAGLPEPRFQLAQVADGALGISNAVREFTPNDAVILTPPLFGMLRLLADRAIVVDFKAFPFGDRDLQSWYQRMLDCYGPVLSTGFAAALDMDANYRTITDARLKAVSEKYGATFAVLYVSTRTSHPVIATFDSVKLVALSETPATR
jgi:hypothetical protein